MRQMKMVNLYFSRDEVQEALRMWCEKNHPALVENFSHRCDMDWSSARPHDPELCLSFDGRIEEVIETSDDTRIFVKK